MKNIDCSVVIGIGAEAASGADEGRLVLAASTVHGSAARTLLRGKSGIDLHETICFVRQHRLDLVPPHIENGTVQATLLSDVLAGVLHSPRRGFRHVLGLQSLDNDRAELPADGRGRLMRPMLTDTGLLGSDSGNSLISLSATSGTALASAGNSLGFACLPIQDGKRFGQHIRRAVGEHQWDSHTPVDADLAVYSEVLNVAVLTPDTDLPAEGRETNGCFRYLAGQVVRHAEPHPSDFRKAYTAPTAVQSLDRYLAAIEGEGIVLAFLLRLRVSANALKETAVSVVQRLKHILLAGLADCADKVYLAAKGGQLSTLRNEVQVVSRPRLIVPPVVAALLKSKIPHKSAYARKLEELIFLPNGRFEPICEASKCHVDNIIRLQHTCQHIRKK